MNIVEQREYTDEYYRARCGGFEFFERFGHKVLKPVFQAALRAAELAPGQKIIDVGCGRGELVAHLAEKGFDVAGVDYARAAVDLAAKSFPWARYECKDVVEVSSTGERFDRAFLLGTIEHLTDDQARTFLDQAWDILRPGGRLVITTCTNRLYYKTFSYKLRDSIAAALGRLGFPMKRPSPPRSDEDEKLHINEQHYFSLKALLSSGNPEKPWGLRVTPKSNPKLSTDALYGKDLPNDFPLRRRPAWIQTAYHAIIFRFPLNLFLARYNLCLLIKN